MLRGAGDPEFYGFVMPDDIPGGITGGLFVERAAAHGVAEIVAENGDALHFADVIPYRPFSGGRGESAASHPSPYMKIVGSILVSSSRMRFIVSISCIPIRSNRNPSIWYSCAQNLTDSTM